MEAITVSAGKRVLQVALLGVQTIPKKEAPLEADHFQGELISGVFPAPAQKFTYFVGALKGNSDIWLQILILLCELVQASSLLSMFSALKRTTVAFLRSASTKHVHRKFKFPSFLTISLVCFSFSVKWKITLV